MHHSDPSPQHRVGARLTSAVVAAATTAALAALTALPGTPAAATGPGGPRHCDGGVCLRYDTLTLVEADTDGDGFPDDDERAAGTDPKDPASHPAVLDVLDLVAVEKLPSFEKHLSEVVLLPEALPDGTKLTDHASLESLTAALGGLAPSRKDGMSRLGISTDLMAEFGVRGSDVMSIVAGAPTGKGEPAFEARVGGIRLAWIAAGKDGGTGASGVGVDSFKDEDGTEYKTVRWFEETDAGTVNFTVTFEMCDSNCTANEEVTVVGGGQDDHCSTVQNVGCFGSLGETANKAYQLMKDKERADKKAAEAKSAEPKPQPSTEPSTQPSSQPSDQPSSQPSSQPSTQPSASETPKPADGGYENPDADQTTVVVTAADVERVVRIVRGSNTTPAQIDVERPTLDPDELRDPTDSIALRDPSFEEATFTTVSPVRTGAANTNYGPDGPRLP